MSCHRDDGEVLEALVGADHPRGGQAVHLRHLDVHEHQVERPPVERVDRDSPVPCDGHVTPQVLQDAAAVYDFRGRTAITAEVLAQANVRSVPRVLLYTDNSDWVRTGPLPETPAHLTEDAARYLIDKGIRLIGIDGLTVDAPGTVAAHAALLRAGVIILETLDLSQVEPGDYQLICLPLRIAGADGAPARAVLRPR